MITFSYEKVTNLYSFLLKRLQIVTFPTQRLCNMHNYFFDQKIYETLPYVMICKFFGRKHNDSPLFPRPLPGDSTADDRISLSGSSVS